MEIQFKQEKSVHNQTSNHQHIPGHPIRTPISEMPADVITVETPNGIASLQINWEWINQEINLTIKHEAFADFLEQIGEETLGSIYLNLLLELEDYNGETTTIRIPIPENIKNKTPEELRQMQRMIDQQ